MREMSNLEASKIIEDGLDDDSLIFANDEQYAALRIAIKVLRQKKGQWVLFSKAESEDKKCI